MSGNPALRSRLVNAIRHVTQPARQVHYAAQRPQVRTQNAFRRQTRPSPRRQAGTFTGNARKLFAENPVSVTVAGIIILIGGVSLIYVNHFYRTYIIGAFHKYPESVAKKLRKALYYTNFDLQPNEAIKFYRQALQVAEEEGMDPHSDEILGVKIQVAFLMEKIQQLPRAVEVLERIRADNLAWLEKYGGLESNKKKRTSVLGKTVAISVKLGELYAAPAVYDREMAEERLVWAVETLLKERQRRVNDRVSDEEEGQWMSNDEIGAALESLAHNYEDKNQHYLATPLFLQALNMYPTQDCHAVILMNNLASSLAQQSPRAARVAEAYSSSRNIDERPTGPVASREVMVENARTWAQKALDIAAGIKPPLRNEECDIGCAVATHNLGEFAEMNHDFVEARRRYQEAISLARATGFQEGVDNSSARLNAIRAKT